MPENKNAPILKGRKRKLSRCHPRFPSGRVVGDSDRTLVIVLNNGSRPGDSYSPLGFRIAAQEGFSTLAAIRLTPTRTRLGVVAFTRFRRRLFVIYAECSRQHTTGIERGQGSILDGKIKA